MLKKFHKKFEFEYIHFTKLHISIQSSVIIYADNTGPLFIVLGKFFKSLIIATLSNENEIIIRYFDENELIMNVKKN